MTNAAFADSTEAVIRSRGLKAASGSRFALGPLDFVLPAGMVTAIVGQNGSGKSTLFRTLLGLEPVLAGAVEVFGTRVDGLQEDAYKAEIGFLAENPHAFEDRLTALEKANFASHWYKSWNGEIFRRLLRAFDVDDRLKLAKMSKGMRRKAELSVVLAQDPALLLLDEPSSGLDPGAWKMMLEELRLYMERGDRTLVIATHIPEEVNRLADYVLFLHRGKSLGMFEKDALFERWRTITVQAEASVSEVGDRRGGPGPPSRNDSGPSALLAKTPGLQEWTQAGPGVYRIAADSAAEAERWLQASGFRVLGVHRMELEDILGCLIRKEEQAR